MDDTAYESVAEKSRTFHISERSLHCPTHTTVV